MNLIPFRRRRTSDLLDRVADDLTHLRNDVGRLIGHTTTRALPDRARALSRDARKHMSASAGRALSHLPGHAAPAQLRSLGILGGVLMVGALAAGAVMLQRGDESDEA